MMLSRQTRTNAHVKIGKKSKSQINQKYVLISGGIPFSWVEYMID